MNIEHQWNENKREKTEVSEEKTVPVLLHPPQIQHGLTLDETLTSRVTGYQLTA